MYLAFSRRRERESEEEIDSTKKARFFVFFFVFKQSSAGKPLRQVQGQKESSSLRLSFVDQLGLASGCVQYVRERSRDTFFEDEDEETTSFSASLWRATVVVVAIRTIARVDRELGENG